MGNLFAGFLFQLEPMVLHCWIGNVWNSDYFVILLSLGVCVNVWKV